LSAATSNLSCAGVTATIAHLHRCLKLLFALFL
jgi:hypothetical protein